MDLTESFLTALDSLRANKLRSILTMLGVIIGVGAVIALMAVGKGFNVYISQQIQSIGTNLVAIAADLDVSNGVPTLAMSDVEALSNPTNAPHVVQVAASVQTSRQVVYQKNNKTATLVGATRNYFDVLNLATVSEGNLFTQADVDTHSRVIVLGATLATDLFGSAYPVGQAVSINGTDYQVVGVLTPKGGTAISPDSQAYLPLTTVQSYIASARTRRGEPALTAILAQASSETDTDRAIREITQTLRQQHDILYAGDDDFRIISQTELLSTFGNITTTITLFLGAIAGISLLVGGIGIMNIMLVSVTERTKEIGIRKAIGALQRDILSQFLLEALMLSLVGGLIGVAMGWGLALLIGPAIKITAVVDVSTIAMATGFAAAVGLGFGIYPAWHAARLHPIEALRYE